jgi:hypothetical protein
MNNGTSDGDRSRRTLSRRNMLAVAGALGTASSFGALDAARAFTAGRLPQTFGDFPICPRIV